LTNLIKRVKPFNSNSLISWIVSKVEPLVGDGLAHDIGLEFTILARPANPTRNEITKLGFRLNELAS
jgi:hypothetical protein